MLIRIGAGRRSTPSWPRWALAALALAGLVTAFLWYEVGTRPGGDTVTIPADRLVDFDQRPPAVIPANPQDGIPLTTDLRVGPDSLLPFNDAENWFHVSGTCASERPTMGLPGELNLKSELATRKSVDVCVYTNEQKVYLLRITTDHADGGGNPYRFDVRSG